MVHRLTLLLSLVPLLIGCGSHFEDSECRAIEKLPEWAEFVHMQVALVALVTDGIQGFGSPTGPSAAETPALAEQQVLSHLPGCVAVEPLVPTPPRDILSVNGEPIATGRSYTFSGCDGPFGIRDLSGVVVVWYSGATVEVASEGAVEVAGHSATLVAKAEASRWASAGARDLTLEFEDMRAMGSGPTGTPLELAGFGYPNLVDDDSDAGALGDTDMLRWSEPLGGLEVEGQPWAASTESFSGSENESWTGGLLSNYSRVGAACPTDGAVGATARDDDGEISVSFEGSNTAAGAHTHAGEDFETHPVRMDCDAN